ncbi:MAG: phosphatase PAP2 family protein [Candidatus Zixiibacteriota bacterium]
MPNRIRAGFARFRPVDWIVLNYCLLMALVIVVLGRPLARYADELAFYLSTAALTVLIVRFVDETQGNRRRFVRLLYPAMLFTLFYRVTGGQMELVFDRLFDAHIVALESSLFGLEPTLYIDQKLLNVWVTEVLSFCYFTYYLIVPGFLVPAFVRGDSKIIREYLAAASLTFFVSYLIFWLYPVEGPRWHLAGQYVNPVDGPLFRQLVTYVIDNAAVRGGAMPSSHTGVALVTLMFCYRYYRKAAWWLLPIVIGLALGTVWGRFHYVSDVVVGAVIGAAAVWLVRAGLNRAALGDALTEHVQLVRTENVP